MSILTNLTEGIVNRDLSKEGEAILNKWEKTGLLEGLDGDFNRNQMAVLLENQAKELLRESNTMAGGDVEGFAAVAFPIVRRVFGGLLAQKLVSVQPMSLPSGLIFFMDFVKQGTAARDGLPAQGAGNDPSVYGGQKVASGILDGVVLSPEARAAGVQTPQFQDLVHGHSVARGATDNAQVVALPFANSEGVASGNDGVHTFALNGSVSDTNAALIQFDPDLLADVSGTIVSVCRISIAVAADTTAEGRIAQIAEGDLRHLTASDSSDAAQELVRRLTRDLGVTSGATPARQIELVFTVPSTGTAITDAGAIDLEYAISDNLVSGTG
jgi:hypothetical protein